MGTYSIHVQVHEAYSGQVDPDGLRRAAELTLENAQADSPVALTVVVTDVESVQKLKAEYWGEDAPTDVLSFPAKEDPATRDPDEPPYLGDILIAWPVAEQQASTAGHSTQDEAHFLTIHGVLHLLGFDHNTPDEQAQMWAMQSVVLDALRGTAR